MNIKNLLTKAVEKGASDLHLNVGTPPVLRIDGNLEFIKGEDVIMERDMESMISSILESGHKQAFLENRELDLGYEVNGSRFRINLHFEKNNIGLVARVINEKIPGLEEIGMPEVIYDLLNLKQGLILVTGPTGCGKSTTLASMVEYINQNRFDKIISFEDPIEYVFKPNNSVIIQRQLGTDMNSFASGLKHAMRQDPDVIMVGEMRDLETIAATVTLAETGHLVLATLHTYNASQTIDRIIDIFPPHQQNQVRMQLSMTLASVISQRLLSKKDGGRVAAREILINTPAVSNLVRENKIAQIRTVLETGSKDGMTSLDQAIQKLYKGKQISKEIAQSYMENPESLK